MAVIVSYGSGMFMSPGTWVGDVVPGRGDWFIVLPGHNVVHDGTSVDRNIVASGDVYGDMAVYDTEAMGYGTDTTIFRVKGGGTLECGNGYPPFASTVIVESGGVFIARSFASAYWAHVIVEPGGLAVVDERASVGPILVESGGEAWVENDDIDGSFVFSMFHHTGGVAVSEMETVPTVDLGSEYRTLHHTGDLDDEDKVVVLPDGPTLYHPDSPDVAPASKILESETNLGTAGTMPLAHVLADSGGTLVLPDESNVRRGVDRGDGVQGTLKVRKPLLLIRR